MSLSLKSQCDNKQLSYFTSVQFKIVIVISTQECVFFLDPDLRTKSETFVQPYENITRHPALTYQSGPVHAHSSKEE